MSAAPETYSQGTAASVPVSRQAGGTAGGTAVAVAAVPQPERGSDEPQQRMVELDHVEVGGSAAAAPPGRRLHWLP